MLDPVTRVVATAPPDEEPVTEQDRLRFHSGQDWFRQRSSQGIPGVGKRAPKRKKAEN